MLRYDGFRQTIPASTGSFTGGKGKAFRCTRKTQGVRRAAWPVLTSGASLQLASLSTAAIAQQSAGPGAASNVPGKVLSSSATAALAPDAVKAAVPLERRLKSLPAEALEPKPAIFKPEPTPKTVPGWAGPKGSSAQTPPPPVPKDSNGGIGTQNYGLNRQNTIYHYTDNLVDPYTVPTFWHRQAGWFVFVAADNKIYRCTASLISRSILVTAGHCVHQGGNQAAGWIKSGTFYAAYKNGSHAGFATANTVYTTSGWYNSGQLDQGYDVGLAVLNKRGDQPIWFTPQELGATVGWYGFCFADCLQRYWYLSQLGYPANYYTGYYQTQGEHLEASDTRDYVYGSGMQGGSSGGPHIANLGDLSDTTANKGEWTLRNIVFAVTSWGYLNDKIKIQGAPSLSGPGNGNNFVGLFNAACTKARALHGTASCTPL
jgi:V8-like Glu-specific endopeptidase